MDYTCLEYFRLTLIWVGFLGVRFAGGVGAGVGKVTSRLKLVRIMLET